MRQGLGRAMRGIWGLAARPGSRSTHACVRAPRSLPEPVTTVAGREEVKSQLWGPARAGETESASLPPHASHQAPYQSPLHFPALSISGKENPGSPR